MKRPNRPRWGLISYFDDEFPAKPRNLRLTISTRIIIGLIAMIAAGTMLLWLPFMGAEDGLTFGEAMFTATSALTVTGLTTISAGQDLSFIGQITLLALIQLGGVGYMFIASLIMRVLGRKLFIVDRLALSNSIGLATPQAIVKVLQRVLVGILIIEGIGTLLLFTYWTTTGIVTHRPFFTALFHAVSAFCNAGFDLFGNPLFYSDGLPNDNISLILLSILILFGGLGIPVLSELVTMTRIRRFSLHTRVTLVVISILVVAGWVGTFLAETGSLGGLANLPLGDQLVQSWFHSISSRTAGFSGFDNFATIRPATQVLTMVLMFIGCAPASMGGGITTGTFAVLGITMYNFVRGKDHIQVWNRELSPQTIRRASSVLTISVGLVMLATFLILMTHPNNEVGPILFEVVSAFATCGLSLGITGTLNGFGQTVIAIMMIWGRLGALTIVVAVAQATATHDVVRYPEEQLLIG